MTQTAYVLRDPGWLARNPRVRAEDLMAAFADPAVYAIIATIGGDDSIRLLPLGLRLRIDSERQQLSIPEAAVV